MQRKRVKRVSPLCLFDERWNEGSVGVALSLMGFTALVVQTIAGGEYAPTAERCALAVVAVHDHLPTLSGPLTGAQMSLTRRISTDGPFYRWRHWQRP